MARNGQLIRPLLNLVDLAQCAIDDLVDLIRQVTIEAVLSMRGQRESSDIGT